MSVQCYRKILFPDIKYISSSLQWQNLFYDRKPDTKIQLSHVSEGEREKIQYWFWLIFSNLVGHVGKSDVRVETDLFYWVSIVVVLLSSQVLSEQSSLNLLREVKYESEEKVSLCLTTV